MDEQKRQRPSKPTPLQALTLKALDESIKNRVQVIETETINGLNLIKKYPKTVTFFGSARTMEDERGLLSV